MGSHDAPIALAQQPLLPEALAPGIRVAAARRNQHELSQFFCREGPSTQDGVESGTAAGVCSLRVFETVLVHYTKRPRTLENGADNVTDFVKGVASDGASGANTEPPVEEKYWKRRFNYFARFDEGIRMDMSAWFEVTPESVARHIADSMPYEVVVDGTCGVGGNAIQFAMTSRHVIAVDLDASRLEDAAHNATIYGVRERIEFVQNDFAVFAAEYRGPPVDAVFLSPPWGGPQHLDADHFSLMDVECPNIVQLFVAAAKLSPRVVLYLPRHVDLHEIALLAAAHGFPAVNVEKVFFQYPTPHLKLCIVYFTPEAAVAPLQSGTTKKVVGPTGGAAAQKRRRGCFHGGTGQRLASSGFASVPLRAAGACEESGRGAMAGQAALLALPPLAGPVIRALYCRYHYLGRYVVALAIALERRSKATVSTRHAPRRTREELHR